MEGLNKYVGTETLVTEATYERVAGQFVFRPLGRFVLKGFERAIGVYELCGRLDRARDFEALHAEFAAALAEFQAGRLDEARTRFLAVQERWPQDGPTRLYLATLDELAAHPATGAWTGAIELKEK
jgi:adenylate cyclase